MVFGGGFSILKTMAAMHTRGWKNVLKAPFGKNTPFSRARLIYCSVKIIVRSESILCNLNVLNRKVFPFRMFQCNVV